MMKLIKIDNGYMNGYINADKIIQIYERPIDPNDSDSALVTVIELEGFGTGIQVHTESCLTITKMKL